MNNEAIYYLMLSFNRYGYTTTDITFNDDNTEVIFCLKNFDNWKFAIKVFEPDKMKQDYIFVARTKNNFNDVNIEEAYIKEQGSYILGSKLSNLAFTHYFARLEFIKNNELLALLQDELGYNYNHTYVSKYKAKRQLRKIAKQRKIDYNSTVKIANKIDKALHKRFSNIDIIKIPVNDYRCYTRVITLSYCEDYTNKKVISLLNTDIEIIQNILKKYRKSTKQYYIDQIGAVKDNKLVKLKSFDLLGY